MSSPSPHTDMLVSSTQVGELIEAILASSLALTDMQSMVHLLRQQLADEWPRTAPYATTITWLQEHLDRADAMLLKVLESALAIRLGELATEVVVPSGASDADATHAG